MYTKKNDPNNLIPKVEAENSKIKLQVQVEFEFDWNTYLAWQGSTFSEHGHLFSTFAGTKTFKDSMFRFVSDRIFDSVDGAAHIKLLSGSVSDEVEEIFSRHIAQQNQDRAAENEKRAHKMIEEAKELLKKAEALKSGKK